MHVSIVLAEQIGESPMVVEMEFERVFSAWLRNGWLSLVSMRTSVRRVRAQTDRSAFHSFIKRPAG
jgi:hypothetical protein